MAQLINLEGVKGGKLEALTITSEAKVTTYLRALSKNRAVTTAGDAGSITVWRDDENVFRGSFCQWGSEKGSITTAETKHLKTWLAKTIPKMHN